jgi:hypothetical protein
MPKNTLLTPEQLLTGQKSFRPVNPSTQTHSNSLTAHSNGSTKQ